VTSTSRAKKYFTGPMISHPSLFSVTAIGGEVTSMSWAKNISLVQRFLINPCRCDHFGGRSMSTSDAKNISLVQ
jgi:hypothetical protein